MPPSVSNFAKAIHSKFRSLFVSNGHSLPHNYFCILTVEAVGLLDLSPRSSRIGEAMLTPGPRCEGAWPVALLPRRLRPDGFTTLLGVPSPVNNENSQSGTF
ncbi:hypothetical protein C8J57DRAFT_1527777 [Mycena rebaudengoi]|nr:hypothetical protein C8J57DRAFT_1527777 [Mycena rebaudengoi]